MRKTLIHIVLCLLVVGLFVFVSNDVNAQSESCGGNAWGLRAYEDINRCCCLKDLTGFASSMESIEISSNDCDDVDKSYSEIINTLNKEYIPFKTPADQTRYQDIIASIPQQIKDEKTLRMLRSFVNYQEVSNYCRSNPDRCKNNEVEEAEKKRQALVSSCLKKTVARPINDPVMLEAVDQIGELVRRMNAGVIKIRLKDYSYGKTVILNYVDNHEDLKEFVGNIDDFISGQTTGGDISESEMLCIDIPFIGKRCVRDALEQAQNAIIKTMFGDIAFDFDEIHAYSCPYGVPANRTSSGLVEFDLNIYTKPDGTKDTEKFMTDTCSASCYCVPAKSTDFCNRYLTGSSTKAGYTRCVDCMKKVKDASGEERTMGFWTGIGCIYTESFKDFIEKNVLGLGISMAGGVALLCIIYSAFMLQTSQGNPEKIKKAQQMLTSCITGLMLIIFSTLILRVIGVDILRIPGLQ